MATPQLDTSRLLPTPPKEEVIPPIMLEHAVVADVGMDDDDEKVMLGHAVLASSDVAPVVTLSLIHI